MMSMLVFGGCTVYSDTVHTFSHATNIKQTLGLKPKEVCHGVYIAHGHG